MKVKPINTFSKYQYFNICSLWTKYFEFCEYIIPEFGKSHYRAIFCFLFYIWNGFLVEHLYKCEKNEYMECCSPISAYLPRDLMPQFILICLFVLMKSYSETSCVGGSCLILTSSFELAPGCPESPENLGLILFLWLMTRSLPNSWNCQSSEAYSALKCGLYREYF